MTANVDSQTRVAHLESLLAHLQHDLEQLGQVVWRQQTEIDDLKKKFGRLHEQLNDSRDEPEPRDPLAEKPPHY